MVEEERADRRNYAVDLAALNAKMDLVAQTVQSESKLLQAQIGFTDRNAAQMVKLVEDKMAIVQADVLEVKVQLAEHKEETKESFKTLRVETQKTVADVAKVAKEQNDGVNLRLTALERFQWKVIGIALGIALVTGGSAGIVANALTK